MIEWLKLIITVLENVACFSTKLGTLQPCWKLCRESELLRMFLSNRSSTCASFHFVIPVSGRGAGSCDFHATVHDSPPDFPLCVRPLSHPQNKVKWRVRGLLLEKRGSEGSTFSVKKRVDEVCDCTWSMWAHNSVRAAGEGRVECHGAKLTQSSFRPGESETTWRLSDGNQGRISNPFTIWGKDEPWLFQRRSAPCFTAPKGMTGF